MEQTLAGRNAFVAGGGRNLGAAVAVELARQGARVALNNRSSSEELEATAERVREVGGAPAVLVQGDVSVPQEARRVMASAVEQLGRVDVLVSAVGRGAHRPFLEIEPEEWTATLHANLTSLCFLAQSALPGMLEGGWGRIIGVGGHANLRGDPYRAVQAAGKAGLVGLVRSISSEFHADGVTANVVSPGAFDTTRRGEADGGRSRVERYGIVRLGQPEEFAAVCAFLASPAAGYVTGQNILVNGGMIYQ